MQTTNFNRFNEVKHLPLKVFNRTMYMHNIKENMGEHKLREYIEGFNQEERKQIFVMSEYIKAKGLDKVRAWVTNGLEFVDG